MRKLKAPFNKYNPKLPPAQRTALKRVYNALQRQNQRRDFFIFCVNSAGQINVHSLQHLWDGHIQRNLVIGRRGGLIANRRYTKLRDWIAR